MSVAPVPSPLPGPSPSPAVGISTRKRTCSFSVPSSVKHPRMVDRQSPNPLKRTPSIYLDEVSSPSSLSTSAPQPPLMSKPHYPLTHVSDIRDVQRLVLWSAGGGPPSSYFTSPSYAAIAPPRRSASAASPRLLPPRPRRSSPLSPSPRPLPDRPSFPRSKPSPPLYKQALHTSFAQTPLGRSVKAIGSARVAVEMMTAAERREREMLRILQSSWVEVEAPPAEDWEMVTDCDVEMLPPTPISMMVN